MPANQKYLTKSWGQRLVKLSAAVVGGYAVSMSLHIALAQWLEKPLVLITATYTAFLLWVVLMVVAYIPQNGWKSWGIYLSLTAVFIFLTYLK